ncbi:MAG: cytochrome c oxidase assembly protein [Betaproteobacteria bacterium]
MSAAATSASRVLGRNRALLTRLGVVALFMFGFGYALVPFYDQICRATGLRDVDRADAVQNTQVDTTRSVRVELDSNLSKLPWVFKPEQSVVTVHPGEVRQILYDVTNTTDRAITGQAIPSYTPQNAVRYFKKLECFCFTRQTLAPGERRQMPVLFVLDPDMPKDMATVSLSYTFFAVEGAN